MEIESVAFPGTKRFTLDMNQIKETILMVTFSNYKTSVLNRLDWDSGDNRKEGMEVDIQQFHNKNRWLKNVGIPINMPIDIGSEM